MPIANTQDAHEVERSLQVILSARQMINLGARSRRANMATTRYLNLRTKRRRACHHTAGD